MNTSIRTINLGGRLFDLTQPLVMEIVNVTPDSFYEHGIKDRLTGDIIDVGGCSTRPGSEPVSVDEEWLRLDRGLSAIRRSYPDALISVDTFRPQIARRCVEQYGVSMINDVSGGNAAMYRTVAELRVPYVLTFNQKVDDSDDITAAALRFFADRVQQLCDLGQHDIVLDPGFGFNKSMEQNYRLLHQLEHLQLLNRPVLVGISRKSMIYRLLDSTPDGALNGTTVLNTMALTKGANILRVHDVKEAKETVTLYTTIK